jgi:hypothetical protein
MDNNNTVRNYEVLYIIEESETGNVYYRTIDHTSGLMKDLTGLYVRQYNIRKDRAKIITVKNLSKFGGKMTQGINDFDTWCRMSNRLDLLQDYVLANNVKPPYMISKACLDRVNWKCHTCGHEWNGYIKNRVQSGARCPACIARAGQGRSTITGVNDLETYCKQHPEMEYLLTEYSKNNEKSPSTISAHSTDSVEWICRKCRKPFNNNVAARVKGQGCPRCSNASSSVSERIVYLVMKDTFKDASLRLKIDGYEADIYIKDINTIIDYRGAYWHEGRKEIDNKKYNYFKSKGINQIVINAKYDYKNELLVNDQISFNGKDYIWLLKTLLQKFNKDTSKLTAEYLLKFTKEDLNKSGVEKVDGCLADTNPEVLLKWDFDKNAEENGLTPYNITAGTKYKAWFKCSRGHQYESMIRKQAQGHGCPICYNTYRKSNNDLVYYYLLEKQLSERDKSDSRFSPEDYDF